MLILGVIAALHARGVQTVPSAAWVAVAGLRQQDVAHSLSLPLNTVKTHLRRARLALADGLADRDTPAGGTGGTDD